MKRGTATVSKRFVVLIRTPQKELVEFNVQASSKAKQEAIDHYIGCTVIGVEESWMGSLVGTRIRGLGRRND